MPGPPADTQPEQLKPARPKRSALAPRYRSHAALLLSVLAYLLLLGGVLFRSGEIVVLALPFVIILFFGFLFTPGKLQLAVNRVLSDDSISPGRPVTVNLTVENMGANLEEIFVEDLYPSQLEILDGSPLLVTDVPKNTTIQLSYVVGGPRGSYEFNRTYARTCDALGIISRQVTINTSSQFVVKPEVWRLRSILIRPLRTHLYTGPIPSRRGGSGMNFFEVREYQIGDPLRRMNWKAISRHDETLFTNQFEMERVTDVGIILDARMQTNTILRDGTNQDSPRSLGSVFEYSIHAAAALADLFLRDGHRVGLLVYGRGQQATFPGYGKTQRERILNALARARTGDNMALESLSYLPARFFPPRSQIIFVSPLSPADPPILTRLLANGYKLLIISPDASSIEAQQLPSTPEVEMALRFVTIERTLLLRRLQRYGITIVDWNIDQPLEKVLGSVLLRTPVEYRKIGIGL